MVYVLRHMFVCAFPRVKELGPGNAADGKAPDTNSAAAAVVGAALSPQKSDLALLRNANVSVPCTVYGTCQSNFIHMT